MRTGVSVMVQFAVALAAILGPATPSLATHFDPQKTGAKYGSGFNSLGSVIGGDCVRRDVGVEDILPADTVETSRAGLSVRSKKSASGQAITYTASQITSVSQFREITNISASASFSYGIYSGGGSFRLFDDQSIDSYSSFMYISIDVENLTQSLKKKLLTDEAIAKMQEGPGPFAAMCGDEFVNALTTGGVFSAVIRFETNSAEHQKQVSAAINGAIGGFGSASGSFSNSLSTLNQLARASIIIVRKGANGNVPALAELDSYALKFPDKVAAGSGGEWPFDAVTFDYHTVSNLPRGVNPEVFDAQRTYLEGLATLRDGALQKRNDLLYVVAHTDQFDGAAVQKATSDLNAQNQFFQTVLTRATNCRLKPATDCSGDYPTPPSVGAPARPASTVSRILAQVEQLYGKRGNRNLAEAGLALLEDADLTGASLDDQYHAELLRSELLLWRFEGGFPGGSASQDYQLTDQLLGQSLGKGVGLSYLLPSHPCEASYLSARYFIERDPRHTPANYRAQVQSLGLLEKQFTREGRACSNYMWDGLHASKGWAELLLADDKGAGDAAQLKAAGIQDVETAFRSQPDIPLNAMIYTVSRATKKERCDATNAYAQRPIPADLLFLDPAISEQKKGTLLILSLVCAAP